MATAELGASRRLRPEARARPASSCRSSRCAAGASSSAWSSGPRTRFVGASEGEVLEAAIQQFYELRGAPPEIHVPVGARRARRARDVAVGSRRPPRAHRGAAARREARASSTSRTATRRSPIRRASTRRQPRSTTRSRRCSTCWRCRRCRVASSASTSRRFRGARPSRRWSSAKTAACGAASTGSSGSGARSRHRRPDDAEPRVRAAIRAESASRTTSRRCTRSCCAAIASCSSRAGRSRISILIDGGKGQLSAAYAALEELGLANLVAVGIAKKEELLFTRDRDDPIALPRTIRRCCSSSASATKRTASRSRSIGARGAMRDLRSELDEVPGVGARRRKTLLTDVRQRGGRPARDARGAGGRRRARKPPMPSLLFRESAVTC